MSGVCPLTNLACECVPCTTETWCAPATRTPPSVFFLGTRSTWKSVSMVSFNSSYLLSVDLCNDSLLDSGVNPCSLSCVSLELRDHDRPLLFSTGHHHRSPSHLSTGVTWLHARPNLPLASVHCWERQISSGFSAAPAAPARPGTAG